MNQGSSPRRSYVGSKLRLALVTLSVVRFPVAKAQDAPIAAEHSIERVVDTESTNERGDGVYGRFKGDLSLSIGVGAELDIETAFARPLLVGDLSFYQSVGLYCSYAESVKKNDLMSRSLSIGATLSPLFLWRWSENWQTGNALFDLTLDSFSLSLGAQLAQPQGGSFAEELGFQGGLSLGLPLFAQAAGPWLRLRGNLLSTAAGVGGSLWLYLSWQDFINLGLLAVD